MNAVQGILGSAWQVFSYAWWLWLPIILWPLFESTWLFWRQELFKHSIDFILLEIKVPREVRKSPKAMEQVFMTIHNLRNAPSDPREKWWDGEVTRWYSFEMVSFGGETHFYIRTYEKQRDIIQAAFFSYYPDVEIVQVDDYIDRMPASVGEMDKSGYDLWGSEFMLSKEAAYPIKSYLDFEAPEEEKQYDPIAVFLEVFSRLKREEMMGVQFILSPAPASWKNKYKDLVEKLRFKEDKAEAAKATMGMEFPHILPTFPIKSAKENGKDGYTSFTKAFMRTPGETDVLKAVEDNLSRPAFKCIIRFIYLSPKELYYDTFPRRGLLGAFNQYGSLDLNSFERNEKVSTRTRVWYFPYLFPGARNIRRKERLLMTYRTREIPPETWMGKLILSKFLNWEHSKEVLLTTRSLATLFHPPTYLVLTAPHMKRVESRKTGPPAGLAIYGDEEEIEKYK